MSITAPLGELEWELEDEYELEDEDEYEDELEGASPVWRGAYIMGEAETEAFFEDLAEYAAAGGGHGGAGGRGPLGGGRGPLGAVASNAALAALGSGSLGVPLARIGRENEDGTYVDPRSGLVRLKPVVVMEHFGHAMTEAESESEAEAFLPFLAPLAFKAIGAIAKRAAPRLLRAARRVAPRLVRGTRRVLRTLRRDPRTRPLVRVLPTIVRRTAADVVRDVQRGRPASPQRAAQQLAAQTQQVLASPQQAVRAYRRSSALDRHYHIQCHTCQCR